MGLVESVRSVMWARRRQPDDVVYGVGLAHERFGPDELLGQAVAAEEAGFDVVACSDHLAPWWEDGDPAPANSGNAWVWLGAATQGGKQASPGPPATAVIPPHKPGGVAPQKATPRNPPPRPAPPPAGPG